MEDKEILLKRFDEIFGTQTKKYIDVNKMPLLLYLYNKVREDLDITTAEYNEIRKEKDKVYKELETKFSDDEKKLFEKYWELENQLHSILEEQLFLSGYLVASEINKEIRKK